jgi:hypothetical protein
MSITLQILAMLVLAVLCRAVRFSLVGPVPINNRINRDREPIREK